MLNEKGLAAAMKLAWKGNGYTAAIADGKIMLKGNAWGVCYDLAKLPRKCLGLLVEHIGGLPDGACFKLQKDLGAQTKLLDEELAFWDEKLRIGENGEEIHALRPTMLTLSGFWLWQDMQTLKIWKVDREYSRILEADALTGGALFAPDVWPALVFTDSYGFAVVMPRERAAEDAMMERLDGFPWCGE